MLAVVEVKGQFLSKAKTTLQGSVRNKTLKEVSNIFYVFFSLGKPQEGKERKRNKRSHTKRKKFTRRTSKQDEDDEKEDNLKKVQNLRRERSPSLHRLGAEPHRQLTTDVHRQGPANIAYHPTALQCLAICTSYRSNWGEFRCILMLFWATPFTCSGLIAALSTNLEICCVWRGVRKRAGAAAIPPSRRNRGN